MTFEPHEIQWTTEKSKRLWDYYGSRPEFRMMCPDCGCIYHKWQHLRTWTADSLRERMEGAGLRTRIVKTVAWQSWQGKLLSLIRDRKITPTGLVYVGELPA